MTGEIQLDLVIIKSNSLKPSCHFERFDAFSHRNIQELLVFVLTHIYRFSINKTMVTIELLQYHL